MLPTGTRILLCIEPQDMRKSFDTLAAAAKAVLGEDPQSGALFVFVGKRGARVKILWWDRNGYCVLAKRFHAAVLQLPEHPRAGASMRIDAEALGRLLAGVTRRSPGMLQH